MTRVMRKTTRCELGSQIDHAANQLPWNDVKMMYEIDTILPLIF
jgi:hypothetical protein